MSKTAIQQAIEDIKSYRSFSETIDIRFVVRLLENVYLDIEKEQLNIARLDGINLANKGYAKKGSYHTSSQNDKI